MSRQVHASRIDNTFCGKSTWRPAGDFVRSTGLTVTDNPDEITCRRCIAGLDAEVDRLVALPANGASSLLSVVVRRADARRVAVSTWQGRYRVPGSALVYGDNARPKAVAPYVPETPEIQRQTERIRYRESMTQQDGNES